ncbi:MAG: hypothetical protein ACREI7_06070 [Myxococcota bacterium]
MRRAGTTLVVAGAALLVWAAVVYFWQEPFTGLYADYQQGRLAQEYEERLAVYRRPPLAGTRGAAPAGLAPAVLGGAPLPRLRQDRRGCAARPAR